MLVALVAILGIIQTELPQPTPQGKVDELRAKICAIVAKNAGLMLEFSPHELLWEKPPFFGFSLENAKGEEMPGEMIFWVWKDRVRLICFKPPYLPEKQELYKSQKPVIASFLEALFPEVVRWEIREDTVYTVWTHNEQGETIIQLDVTIDQTANRVIKVTNNLPRLPQ